MTENPSLGGGGRVYTSRSQQDGLGGSDRTLIKAKPVTNTNRVLGARRSAL